MAEVGYVGRRVDITDSKLLIRLLPTWDDGVECFHLHLFCSQFGSKLAFRLFNSHKFLNVGC